MTLEQAASCCITTWRSPPHTHHLVTQIVTTPSRIDVSSPNRVEVYSRVAVMQFNVTFVGGGGHAIIKLHNHVNSGWHIWGRFKVSFGLLPDSAKTCLQFKSAPVSLLLMDGHFGLDTEDKCQCHATLMYSSLEQSLSVSLLVDARFRFRWNCWTPC